MAALGQLAFLVLMVGGFYALAIRPQKARIRALQATQASLAPGQRVITTAGLHGTVVEVDDGDVLLEAAPGVVLRFARGAIAQTISEPTLGGAAAAPASSTLPPS
ncbi:MAG TPA: preprotein translocase subunit YajC [Mycobacteriales bacterium]|nr:preprotein translocase subunit YajC [Mycobacteriales bacterium]